MNTKIALPALLGLMFTAVNIHAAEGVPIIFEDIDADTDGCISKDEAKVRDDLIKNFARIDKDKGGTICVDEYTSYENKGRLMPEEVEIPEVGAAPME